MIRFFSSFDKIITSQAGTKISSISFEFRCHGMGTRLLARCPLPGPPSVFLEGEGQFCNTCLFVFIALYKQPIACLILHTRAIRGHHRCLCVVAVLYVVEYRKRAKTVPGRHVYGLLNSPALALATLLYFISGDNLVQQGYGG